MRIPEAQSNTSAWTLLTLSIFLWIERPDDRRRIFAVIPEGWRNNSRNLCGLSIYEYPFHSLSIWSLRNSELGRFPTSGNSFSSIPTTQATDVQTCRLTTFHTLSIFLHKNGTKKSVYVTCCNNNWFLSQCTLYNIQCILYLIFVLACTSSLWSRI
jgi:hypothetical protein